MYHVESRRCRCDVCHKVVETEKFRLVSHRGEVYCNKPQIMRPIEALDFAGAVKQIAEHAEEWRKANVPEHTDHSVAPVTQRSRQHEH